MTFSGLKPRSKIIKIIVNWSSCVADSKSLHYNGGDSSLIQAIDLAAIEPVPLFPYLLQEREGLPHECYALQDFCKNAFVVLSPVDMTITVNPETDFLTVAEFTTQMYNLLCYNRGKTDKGYLMTMPPAIVFYTNQDVVMETISLSMLEIPKNTSVIPGRFNISKWVRPVDWTFELLNGATEVEVKRGDALFVVRFFPVKNGNVVLERVAYNENLHNAVMACTTFKLINRKVPLTKLYEIGKDYIGRFLKL